MVGMLKIGEAFFVYGQYGQYGQYKGTVGMRGTVFRVLIKNIRDIQ